jgi:hypothetical protein
MMVMMMVVMMMMMMMMMTTTTAYRKVFQNYYPVPPHSFVVLRLLPFFFNSLGGGWSPTGSTRHGGH